MMGPSLWDIVAGAGLSICMLTILLFGTWRVRRAAFLVFCLFAISTFVWRAGCWYHQFSCDSIYTTAALKEG
ncbi:MAG: hypothetical protein E6Q98_09825 [Rhodospirillaceae bacterium]|nr:MAG: hypothetical protein E6Q98_09825 [Rhodospirillaceae bacterium]